LDFYSGLSLFPFLVTLSFLGDFSFLGAFSLAGAFFFGGVDLVSDDIVYISSAFYSTFSRGLSGDFSRGLFSKKLT
jgi:hypothetical protein